MPPFLVSNTPFLSPKNDGRNRGCCFLCRPLRIPSSDRKNRRFRLCLRFVFRRFTTCFPIIHRLFKSLPYYKTARRTAEPPACLLFLFSFLLFSTPFLSKKPRPQSRPWFFIKAIPLAPPLGELAPLQAETERVAGRRVLTQLRRMNIP